MAYTPGPSVSLLFDSTYQTEFLQKPIEVGKNYIVHPVGIFILMFVDFDSLSNELKIKGIKPTKQHLESTCLNNELNFAVAQYFDNKGIFLHRFMVLFDWSA